MTQATDLGDGVKVFAPDHKLHEKIGKGSLDRVLSKEAIAHAEQAVQESAAGFAAHSKTWFEALEAGYADLQNLQTADKAALTPIIDAAFQVKTTAAQGGYDLVAAIAKSLHLHCENLESTGISPKTLDVIGWHISSIRHLLQNNVKGEGGTIGAAIMEEIRKLTTQPA